MKTIKLELVKQSNPYGDFCSLMHYKDEQNRSIFFRDTNNAFEYQICKGTHKDFENKKVLTKVADAFVDKGLAQHQYKGGYKEAIQTLIIKL